MQKNLWEVTDADFSEVSREGYEHVVEYLKNHSPADLVKPRFAEIVSSGNFEFAMTRMFELMATTDELTLKVFQDFGDAEAWLLRVGVSDGRN